MPRVLILHASVGTGHKSAAQALGAAFARRHAEVRVEDTLDYSSPLFREAYAGSYLRLSEYAPLLWRLFYENTDTSDLERAIVGSRWRGRVEQLLVSRLEQLVEQFAPAAIVCTHPLPIEVLLRLKLNGELLQPIFCVVTDFVAHSFWINSGVDGYFLASDLTRDELIARGLPQAILHVSGIPVNLEIAEPKDKARMRTHHNLPLEVPLITLFGGGLDPMRVRMMVTRLLMSETPGTLVVVAGRNTALTRELDDQRDGPHMQLRLLGRIGFVDDLVAASDLVITKAGGLIVSEVLARGVPLLLIDPIPGQEEWNADYVVSVGAGIQLRMPEAAPRAALSLLAQPERLAALRERAAQVGRPRAALDIAERVLAELQSGRFKA